MKPYTILKCDQRSDEWKAARCGLITSTCADAILAKGRKAGEESVQRRDLRVRLACEKMTGVPIEDDGYKPAWVGRGSEREADARLATEVSRGYLIRQTGFLKHTSLPIGTSLDGDVDNCTGVVELKCPRSATHLAYLRDPGVPATYIPQLAHHFLVSGAAWADFVSFDDRFPEPLQLVIRRVMREQIDVKSYELALRMFLREVDEELRNIRALMERAA